MKKLELCLCFAVLLSVWGNAQTNTFPNDGNVGIGTLSPSSKLSVLGQDVEFYSGTAENKMMVGRNDSEKFQFRTTDNHGYIDYIQDSDGDGPHVLYIRNLAQGSNVANDIQLHTSSGLLAVKKDGNVGVGTTSPSAKLHIEGDGIRALRFSTSNINDRNNDSPWYGMGRSNYVDLSNDDTKTSVQLAGYYGLLLKSAGGFIGIHQNGNIGIGTSSPDSKLTIKGKVHAEEVKVDLSVPGPDYVFKEGYDLKSLEEVQNYIQENRHLPNIPSAKEMEANGIELGEMNMKLLEKIEELTLYVIELKNEINLLKQDKK